MEETKQTEEENDYYMSQEFFNEIMDECEEERIKIEEEEARVNNRLLNVILRVKGKKFYKDLLFIIKDCQVHGQFEIIETPQGKYQEEGHDAIKGYWVYQCQADDSGDSFYGGISVKLKEKKYLLMFF